METINVTTQPPYRLWNLLPIFMVILLDVMGIVLIFPVLTPLILSPQDSILPLTTPLLLRDFIYGLSIAIFPFFMFFSTPILGDLSDRYGRKIILLICLILTAISYLISALGIIYHSLWILLASRALAGVGAGTQPIANAAIIDMSTAKNKTRHLSWIVLVSSAGIILGPLVGGTTAEKNIIPWFGYDTPFFIAAFLAFLNSILLFFIFTETVPTNAVSKKIRFSAGFILFISAFVNKKFRFLSFAFFCFLLAWSLYFQIISWFFMEVHHYSVSKIGFFIGYMGVIFVFATIIMNRFILKFFKQEISAFLFFITSMGIANFGAALSQSELAQWLWIILNALSDAICYTIGLSIFSNMADKDSQGWIMGVVGAIIAITWTIGGLIAGPLGYLNIHLPFAIAGLLCFISLIVMMFYRKFMDARTATIK